MKVRDQVVGGVFEAEFDDGEVRPRTRGIGAGSLVSTRGFGGIRDGVDRTDVDGDTFCARSEGLRSCLRNTEQ